MSDHASVESLWCLRSGLTACTWPLLFAVFVALVPDLAAAEEKPEKLLRHVVCFQFKDDATEDQIREVEKAFAQLPKKIDAIVDFEWGTDVSTENRTQGFTHCFLVSFRDEAGRDAYLPHPAHKEFVQIARPRIENVLVIDYWSQR